MKPIDKELLAKSQTQALSVGKGAMAGTPDMFRKLFGDSTAVVVAHIATWKVAGEQVYGYLKAAGIPMVEPFVFDDPDMFAEWSYLEQLEAYLKDKDAIAVAVGSGVINDLTKQVSHRLGRKYMIVGTAASMDGYTAYGSSITIDGNKQTLSCPAPYGMILDPEVAAAAPEGMSASGYADLIAKVPSGADWMIADAAGVEAMDQYAFDLVEIPMKEALSDPAGVAAGDVDATEKLAYGLIMSGFAMQAYKSSRPSSGLEHQFSHYWDMENLSYPDGKHVSHGFKVGIGTLASTACLEFLLGYDMDSIDPKACAAAWPTWEELEAHIRKLFANQPGHLSRALIETRDKYVDAAEVAREAEALKAAWPSLKERIRRQILPFDEVKEQLRTVRAPYESEQICVSREKFRSTFLGIPFMRSRFTSIDAILRLGLMDECVNYLFDGPNPVF